MHIAPRRADEEQPLCRGQGAEPVPFLPLAEGDGLVWPTGERTAPERPAGDLHQLRRAGEGEAADRLPGGRPTSA